MVNRVSQKLADYIQEHPRLKAVVVELEGPITLIYYISLGFLIGLILQYVFTQL